MRVGVIAYLMHAGSDYRAAGVSVYTQMLLLSLPAASPQHEYLGFHGRDAPELRGVQSIISPWPTSHPVGRIAWEQTGLLRQLGAARVDLAHGTVNVLPLAWRGPSVVTVHDLSFLRVKERLPRSKVAYLKRAVSYSARKATRLIAVSQHTRADLVELLRVPESRIDVVYSGVDPSFRPLGDEQRQDFRATNFGGRPYILHVGTLEPRKNLDILIAAFDHVRRELGLPHVLALVGGRGWMYEQLFRQVESLGLSDSVQFVDYVPPDRLPLWYTGADLFAYPSAYEGFGLPVLEAMACGVPTITSASSALQELAGTACLTVEAGSQEALQMAIARVLTDSQLRSNMSQAGLRRASGFTWETTARQTVQVYQTAMGATRGT